MKEQEFQVELERFKQKASWEKTIFYFSLTALWGLILISLKDELKIFGLDLIWWILILGVLMSLGEFFVQNYLDTQASILRKKVTGKDAKIWDDNKLRNLIVLEKKKLKIKSRILKNKVKTERLEEKLKKISSKIEILKEEIYGDKK